MISTGKLFSLDNTAKMASSVPIWIRDFAASFLYIKLSNSFVSAVMVASDFANLRATMAAALLKIFVSESFEITAWIAWAEPILHRAL